MTQRPLATETVSISELRARRVLADCRWALSRYSPELCGEALRVGWVSVMTLLRAVGHVLCKVDARQHPAIGRAVNDLWKNWTATKPKPTIFWGFIQSERNTVLKQYEFGFSRTFQEWRSEQAPLTLELRGEMLALSGERALQQHLPDLRSLIVDGPFRGRSESEVAEEAIEWWEQTLTEIERRVLHEGSPN